MSCSPCGEGYVSYFPPKVAADFAPRLIPANSNVSRYYTWVIRSFHDRDTERLCRRERIRRLPADLQRVALRKLLILDAATSLARVQNSPTSAAG